MSKAYDAAFRIAEYKHIEQMIEKAEAKSINGKSDGSTADYYELPEGATQLQDLISFKNMNAQVGEIFRACYRMGQVSHSPNLRDAKKILFYAQAEVKRLGG
jgi:hypothetical protein